jgi:hypothetical protein
VHKFHFNHISTRIAYCTTFAKSVGSFTNASTEVSQISSPGSLVSSSLVWVTTISHSPVDGNAWKVRLRVEDAGGEAPTGGATIHRPVKDRIESTVKIQPGELTPTLSTMIVATEGVRPPTVACAKL